MLQRRRDGSSGDTSTQLPLEIILPVAASVVFLIVLALVFVHRICSKLDDQTKSVLHSPSLLAMSDLEANRQWLNGLECLRCLGLGRPKSACSLGLEVKCRGERAFDDGAVPPPTSHALPQNVFFPGGRQSSCWFQSNSRHYGFISPGVKYLFGGKAVPDICITVPAKSANKETPSFLQNRRWTRAFKHDLGLVGNGLVQSCNELPSECSPMRRIAPRRRFTSAPRALFHLRLARSAALPTISEARESCCSIDSGAVKGFVAGACMPKIDNRASAVAGIAPESTLSSSAPSFSSQHAHDVSLDIACGDGSYAFRNAACDKTDRLIVDSDSVADPTAIETSSDSSASFLPYFDSGSSSTACIPITSSSCCSPSRSSGTSDLAYSGCSISTCNCESAPSLAGPKSEAGNKRGSLNGLSGVELWIDGDADLFYYVGPA